MKTEKGLFISPLQITKIRAFPKSVSFVYLGSDSCEHLMPDAEEVKFVYDKKLNVIISVPILTDFHLSRLSKLIEKILSFLPFIEISVNDIGTLECLKQRFGAKVHLSVGRYLFSIFIRNSLSFVQDISEEFNVHYFETDDFKTADSFLRTDEFRIAFHYPFRYYSITRICPYKGNIVQECDRECEGKIVPLDKGQLFWQGNYYFMPSSKLPKLAPQRIIIYPRSV